MKDELNSAPDGIYALGHSTRQIEEFVELLHSHNIQLLVDIRTVPKSRHNPQFSQENLERDLLADGIRYLHLPSLGGLRKPKFDSVNLGWENSSFRGFADYMQTPEFERALTELIELARHDRVAIMCAEGNPFRCHRMLVADALTARGTPVYHIVSRKTARLHKMTPFAEVEDTRVTFPLREGNNSRQAIV